MTEKYLFHGPFLWAIPAAFRAQILVIWHQMNEQLMIFFSMDEPDTPVTFQCPPPNLLDEWYDVQGDFRYLYNKNPLNSHMNSPFIITR